MSTALRLRGHYALLLSAVVAVAACGHTETGNDSSVGEPDLTLGPQGDGAGGGPDLAGRDLGPCGGPCTGATPLCDRQSGRCVACLADADCAQGMLCRMGSCVNGCTAQRGCGDAGACEVDAGRCVECTSDGDCALLKDPQKRFCHLPTARCVPCRPDNDTCPDGQFCRDDGQGHVACAPGCKLDQECRGDGGASYSCCDHACVDTASSSAHCGRCGGSCGADPDAACCASQCVHTDTDVSACGGCGKTCRFANAAATCAAGNCKMGMCNAGFANCNGDPVDGCEVGVASDLKNCGACGVTCMVPNAMAGCVGGMCVLAACQPGYRNCDGMIANGCEIASASDPNNCGNCGAMCGQLPKAMAGCVAGACVVASCVQGFGNCDKMDNNGCEADLSSSLTNCGMCANACALRPNVLITCVAGKCVDGGCALGYDNCDGNVQNGCEAKLATDAQNCGACGKACGAMGPNTVATCAIGACVFACKVGFADCDGDPQTGCEVNVDTDVANCGKCGVKCPVNNVCKSGACVNNCGNLTPLVIGGVTFCYTTMAGTCQGAHQLCEALGNGYRLFCGNDWVDARSGEGCGGANAYTAYDIVNQLFPGSEAIGTLNKNVYDCVTGGKNNQCRGDSAWSPNFNVNGYYAFCAPKNYYKNPPDGPAFNQVCGN